MNIRDLSIDGISITVYATQDTVESDSFGNTVRCERWLSSCKVFRYEKGFC